jgi:hypothetical protein
VAAVATVAVVTLAAVTAEAADTAAKSPGIRTLTWASVLLPEGGEAPL